MFKFNEYVNASDIWPTAKNHEDLGEKLDLVRGYNIEVRKDDGTTYWMSACWFSGAPEYYYNDDFHDFYFCDLGVTPTGRICFRGYGREKYDWVERDTYIEPVEV